MIKFKKGYSVKIVALFVAVSFFLNSIVYGLELPKYSNLNNSLYAKAISRNSLRIPVGQKRTFKRMQMTMSKRVVATIILAACLGAMGYGIRRAYNYPSIEYEEAPAFYSISTGRFSILNDFDKNLKLLQELENKSVHYIDIHGISYEDKEESVSLDGAAYLDAIEKVRSKFLPLRNYIIEASKTPNNIPPHVLLAEIFSVQASYTAPPRSLRRGLNSLVARDVVSEKVIDFLHSILPDWIENRTFLDSKMQDFLGGVVVEGKTIIGITQMRPVWVRRYDGWKRFSIDANKLSNREISWLLLDPKYAFEALARMWRGAIKEVYGYKRAAILYNEIPNTKPFEREGTAELYITPLSAYKSIPDPEKLGNNDWIVGLYHVAYGWRMAPSILYQDIVLKSGIFDAKPGEFIGIETPGEVDIVASFLGNNDPYFRNAAIQTFKNLINDSNEQIARRAREIISRFRKQNGTREILQQRGGIVEQNL